MKLIAAVCATVMMTACSHFTPNNKPIINQISPTSKNDTSAMTAKTITIKSAYNFDTTTAKLSQAITSKGMTIFATIDHQKAAADVNLSMQPATVIVFGTPKAGTPLMIKDPNFALQLPLKVLITEVNGDVLVSFNDTKALINGSDISFDDVKNTLAAAENLIKTTVQ
ncbi:DUF302 domain-containing protein [Moraxella haemolytica]|uniref:DUF302 domain-containing protein n=1 Tax=Moraxella TaxID=475 RepID=UPI002543AD6D|nr:DUF302 domain-containing protein [Moraxella sp. ZY171148]WII95247.1 DUF302 domain-containing protein [Moraxella sp. ZY171148]